MAGRGVAKIFEHVSQIAFFVSMYPTFKSLPTPLPNLEFSNQVTIYYLYIVKDMVKIFAAKCQLTFRDDNTFSQGYIG